MSVLKLSITSGRPNTELVTRYQSGDGPKAIVNSLCTFINGLATGSELAASASLPPAINIVVDGNQVSASGTITFSGVSTANDTVLINGVTFTTVASGATGNQWNIGADATASAANLAIAINASATALVNQFVTAASVAGVLTITAANGGVQGNSITIAEGVDAGSVMTVSGARLTAGAADTAALTLSF